MYKKICLPLFFITTTIARADESAKVIHVLVALCDNDYQGIVKVLKHLGNGDDPKSNLYWGCSEGVKATFSKSPHWKLLKTIPKPNSVILERAIFHHTSSLHVGVQ
jgi:hypothetical protein